MLDHFEITFGSFRVHVLIVSVSLGDDFGITFGSFCVTVPTRDDDDDDFFFVRAAQESAPVK